MVFYLKVNRTEPFALDCLQHWVDAIAVMHGEHKIYVVCDKEELKAEILSSICFWGTSFEMLASNRTSPELDLIVSNVTDDKWRNAGFAHLTTFLHARDHGYSEMWNIDADDTMFCLDATRAAEIFETAEKEANANQIDFLAFDIWTTKLAGRHISFGVTYVKNPAAWMETMLNHCEKYGAFTETEEAKEAEFTRIVDKFISYLSRNSIMRAKAFYVENLRFIHSDNLYRDTFIQQELYHWKDGILSFPILDGIRSHASEFLTDYIKASFLADPQISLPENLIRLDINASDAEWNRCLATLIYPMLSSILAESIPERAKVILYGTGGTGRIMAAAIQRKKHCELLCMTSRSYQNKQIEGVTLCALETALRDYDFDYLVISAVDRTMNLEIWNTLLEQGVLPKQILSCYPAQLNSTLNRNNQRNE